MISGLVQGVFFRREIADLARKRDINGWVRNLPDGSVEVVADRSLSAARLVDILSELRRLGIGNISLITVTEKTP